MDLILCLCYNQIKLTGEGENAMSVSMLLAAAAAVGFLYALGQGVLRLFGKAPAREPAARGKVPAQRLVFGAALLWCAVMLTALCIAAWLQQPELSPLEAVRSALCGGLDARHYLDLAQWGYGATEEGFAEQYLMIVFFPLWGWLLRPFALLGADLWLVGTVLAVLLTAAGTVLLYRCVFRLTGNRRTAGFACAVQLAMPGSFFFVLPQTEALFYFLNFAFLDAMQRRRLGLAGVFGLLAALCRANGILLAGYAVAWAVLALRRKEKLRPAWLLPVIGPAVGIFVYLLLNWKVYGNAFQFTIYQQEHWHHSFCLFPQAIVNMCRYADFESSLGIYIGLWTVAVILLEILVYVLAAKKLRPDWLLLGLAGVLMMNGQTWLISAQRYALGMPALPCAVAALSEKRWVRIVLLAALAVFWAIYFAAFIGHAPIY